MKLDPYRLAEAILDHSARELAGLKQKELREYKAHVQAEAAEWFDSESIEPLSYRWCCAILAVDPAEFRAGVEETR